MSLTKPTIVIFDMDGTAVRHLNPAILHILERLDDLSYKITQAYRTIVGEKLRKRSKRKRPRLLVHRAIHKIRRRPVEQIVEPCPGLYDLLDFLKAHDIPLGIVSNGLGSGYGHDILEKFELEDYFQATIFREDIRNSKPNPEPLKVCLRRMKIKQKASDVIWYIGDRHKDITMALAANDEMECSIVPIAFAVNAAVAVLEKSVGQDHIIPSFYDIRERLEDLLGPEPKPKSKLKDKPATKKTKPKKATIKKGSAAKKAPAQKKTTPRKPAPKSTNQRRAVASGS